MRHFILICLAWAAPAFGQCLTDFHVNQMWHPHALIPTQLETATRLAREAKPAEGWRFLADLGDAYAALAADVLSPRPGGSGRALHAYIRRHWVNTVGAATTDLLFASFARQHFRQYVEVMLAGSWPDADQILNSYLGAARAHGLPELVVFDAAWTASDYAKAVSWQTLNHLPASRRVRASRVCLNITREEANRSLARDLQTP